MLSPGNLARYEAHGIEPARGVCDVVDQYWHVSWSLPADESLDQSIIDLPAVTITIEDGDVPAPLMVTGVQSGAWRRRIHGRGRVFAIRLRPAGLAVVSDLDPTSIEDSALELTERLDPRLFGVVQAVAAKSDMAERAFLADQAIGEALAHRAPRRNDLLANRALDELRARVRSRTGEALANQLGVSQRTLQRALTDTLGHGPKWISRRIRLQEVALALASKPREDLANIAAELGYTDQSHLAQDFRSVAGVTPSTYRVSIQQLQA